MTQPEMVRHEEANGASMTGPPRQPQPVFVGRDRELATLRASLTAALAGQVRVVVLAGEPGIGKTRLAEELAREASARGATVRWGRCWEGPGVAAFWPWVQILRAQFAETDPVELRVQLEPGAEDIVQLVPELRDILPGIASPQPLEVADTRFRLFDSIARFLKAAARRRALTLILEDVHWADAASLGLLRFLAGMMRDTRLLIVTTHRNVAVRTLPALAELQRVLAYNPLVERIELQGLSEHEIGALVEALGHERSASLVARIARESGGNPFFATEIVRALGVGIPPQIAGSVRDAVGERLRQLSDACRGLLGVASVIGPEFGLALIERVAADAEAADGTPVLLLLNEATRAGIVVEVPGPVGSYCFAHALIREVLYTELPLARRLRLHWHVAAALEARGGLSLKDGASALAHHFSEAIAGQVDGADRRTCVDKAVRYTTQAAEQARVMLAYEDAATQYEQALRTLEAWAPLDTRRQCEVLLALGEAQTCAAAKYADRNETFRRAAALARQRNEPERLARAALGLAAGTSVLEATSQAHAALLQEALEAVGTQDSALRARLLAQLAMAKYYPDPCEHSASLAAEAVAVARRVGHAFTVALCLSSRYGSLTQPEQAEERTALATELLQLCEQQGFRELAMWARLYHLYEALEAGQIATVERDLATYARLADELRQPLFRSQATGMRAALALLRGHCAEAEELALAALALMQHAEHPVALQGCLNQLSAVYWDQGRFGELERLLEAGAEQLPFIPGQRAMLAYFYAEVGRVDDARAEIERLSADAFGGVPRDTNWLAYMALLANACALIGDSTHAPALYTRLLPHAGNLVVTRSGPVCLGSVSLYLGLLAGVMGRWDEALAHLDEALAVHVRVGSPPWIANTQWALAAVLLGREGRGDRARANALLAEARRIVQRLVPRQREPTASDHDEGGARSAGIPQTENRNGPAAAPASGADSVVPARRHATLRKEGDCWAIAYTGPVFRLKDRLGLQYLAVLLREPGREFLAVDLVAAVQRGGDHSTTDAAARAAAHGIPAANLDEPARRAYTQRLRALRDARDEAEAFHDRERAGRAQAEIDVLTHELRRGLGLDRRVRPVGSALERARVSLTHAVKDALRAIAEHDAALGQYLTATVKTGTFCSYSPDPRVALTWYP